MKKLKAPKSFRYYQLTTFLTLLIGYAGYYLCRQNMSVSFLPMQQSMGLTAMQFGWITSIGTLAYAVGKVITGSMADGKHGGKKIFFIGMFASAIFCAAFAGGSSVPWFILLWSFTRFFQSMGWGGLINIMARWYAPAQYGTAMGFMSVSFQFGGIFASLFAGVLLAAQVSWTGLFVIPAILLVVLGLGLWPFMKNSPTDVGMAIPHDQNEKTEVPQYEDSHLSYFARFKILMTNKKFLITSALAAVMTFLRECFNVWVPTYFASLGASASSAAFRSMVFPLLGCLGTLFAGWVSDHFLKGRRMPVLGALLLGMVLSFIGLSQNDWLANYFQVSTQTTALWLMGSIGFFLLGPYSLIGGVIALDFGGRKTCGTAAGLLDGAGYLGGMLAGVGVANFVIHEGWSVVYLFMAALGLLALALCGLLWNLNKIHLAPRQ